ncbi:uncharacterized protein F5Z01DRAFT_215655 [Emericellopsis atlantica]|uniref:Uncharacterized protein n=1 Tax=Emericellopsis atlantica TaxID=2614577 RepID=A0A9P7ZVP9_9HYPO|nr:uncharacterized protein F5Z01DRAFT_215655 [Emericellopsis atlantica]KAG9258727.1 hypothetical protein F5Z01DRAFT_215655 [Emericellopsis atlantica]
MNPSGGMHIPSALAPVHKAYNEWLDHHKGLMRKPELEECKFVAAYLRPDDRSENDPTQHWVFLRYTTNKRDVVWGVFYGLRLLYIDKRRQYQELRGSAKRKWKDDVGTKLLRSDLATLIKQRYPGIDLEYNTWPGRAPARPHWWPILGERWSGSPGDGKRFHAFNKVAGFVEHKDKKRKRTCNISGVPQKQIRGDGSDNSPKKLDTTASNGPDAFKSKQQDVGNSSWNEIESEGLQEIKADEGPTSGQATFDEKFDTITIRTSANFDRNEDDD